MTVYLIHFAEPYRHARHYLGSAKDLDARLRHHRDGRGANLLRVLRAAGIDWDVVRTWDGDRKLERQLKNLHHSDRLCPICRQVRELRSQC